MGMTIVEKILAAHCGVDEVKPGQLVNAKVDIVLGNDITAPIAIEEFRKIGVDHVFDRERVVLVPDHSTPSKDIKSAELCRSIRNFANEQAIVNYFEVGRMGIEHALLPELGLIVPGDIVVGADSHTCTYGALGALATGVGSTDMAAAMATGEAWFKVPKTIKFTYQGQLRSWVGGKDIILYTIGKIGVDGALYKSIEFSGPVIEALTMDGRFTMCNMAIEAGAKCGVIAVDEITMSYLDKRAKRKPQPYAADADAIYDEVITVDMTGVEPQVAFPSLPSNVKPVTAAAGIKIDQVVIGSCTNGRIEDLRIAAKLLSDKKVAKHVRMIVIPATQAIYRQAIAEGLIEIFIDAEAAVSTPTCGPCLGGHMGVLAAGERAVATTNRNFVGRMGHPLSEVYLTGPAVAAASAVAGTIVGPDDI